MIYDDDMDVFLDDDEFADDITYLAYGSASGSSIHGIFDAPGSIVTIGRVSMVVERQQVRVKTSDISSITSSDTMTIDSIEYKVGPWTHDGTGMSTVILAEGKR
jgi:hypothetical protein